MPTGDGSLANILGIIAVLALVAANGFFVAAEFSLVAVRRSRVTQLVEAGKRNARALQRALDRLDAYLAACQLGITISSLALGWIGEPALARLIEPWLSGLGSYAARRLSCHRRGDRLHHHHRAPYRAWRAGAEEPRAAEERSDGPLGGASALGLSFSAAAGDRCAERPRQPCAQAMRPASRHCRRVAAFPGRVEAPDRRKPGGRPLAPGAARTGRAAC